MESTIGPERNLLHAEPESCRQIAIKYPIIDNDELAKLRHINSSNLEGFRSITLPMLYSPGEAGGGLERAMDRLCAQASQAVADGHTILILSDRGVGARPVSRTSPPRADADVGVAILKTLSRAAGRSNLDFGNNDRPNMSGSL